jgi:hypothetical protein
VTLALPALVAFRSGPALRELAQETGRLVALRAANGVGKTMAACHKVARRAVEKPGSKHRVISPSHKHAREVAGKYLWDFLRDYVASNSRWLPGTGWTRNGTVVLANGSEIQIMSYQDDPEVQEGRHDLDTILLDEVPPEAHYLANKGRAGYQLIVAFTVQDEVPPDWLRKEIEGDDESPVEGRTVHSTGWVQYVVPFLRHNVPFYTDEKYEQKRSSYVGTDAEGRRIWAQWEATSSIRKFSGWSQKLVRTNAEIRKVLFDERGKIRRPDRARIGIDYGHQGIAKHCQYLILQYGQRFFVVHEFLGGRTTTPTDIAVGIRDAIEAWFGRGTEGLAMVEMIRGDLNSAGPLGGGQSLNSVVEHALCALYGITSLPQPQGIHAPNKQEGWREAREIGINHAMLEGRWIVSDECPHAIRAYNQYRGKPNDPFKDPVDAQGYAVQDLVLTRSRPVSAARVGR